MVVSFHGAEGDRHVLTERRFAGIGRNSVSTKHITPQQRLWSADDDRTLRLMLVDWF